MAALAEVEGEDHHEWPFRLAEALGVGPPLLMDALLRLRLGDEENMQAARLFVEHLETALDPDRD